MGKKTPADFLNTAGGAWLPARVSDPKTSCLHIWTDVPDLRILTKKQMIVGPPCCNPPTAALTNPIANALDRANRLPPEMTPSTAVNAAREFLGLGAPIQAWDTLEELPLEYWTHPDVLACKLAIMTAFGQWNLGLELLNLLEPSSEDQHRQDCARFCQAYAGHLCALGHFESAKDHVTRASRSWPAMRLAMLDDPGLRELWKAGE